MALAKVACRTGNSLLRSKKLSVLCASNFQTSATSNAWYHVIWPYKPEYDENGKELGLPHDHDTATGMWKKEIDARAAGVKDPFGVLAKVKGDQGTKIDPIMIPSAYESRTIGCHCEPETNSTISMWLHQGELKRCRCGYWFQLYYEPPFVEYKLPA